MYDQITVSKRVYVYTGEMKYVVITTMYILEYIIVGELSRLTFLPSFLM